MHLIALVTIAIRHRDWRFVGRWTLRQFASEPELFDLVQFVQLVQLNQSTFFFAERAVVIQCLRREIGVKNFEFPSLQLIDLDA